MSPEAPLPQPAAPAPAELVPQRQELGQLPKQDSPPAAPGSAVDATYHPKEHRGHQGPQERELAGLIVHHLPVLVLAVELAPAQGWSQRRLFQRRSYQ